jgi:glutamate-5-semialdehyde dehydrogenase
MMTQSINDTIEALAQRARAAALELAQLSSQQKNAFLKYLAQALTDASQQVLKANAIDLEQAQANGLRGPMLERLKIDASGIRSMADGILQVAALPDPVGQELERLNPARGFDLRKIRVPMGVIGIIYESRPNVTIDCAILCLKSGNAAILRGGKEAFNTNQALALIIKNSLLACDIQPDAVQLIPTTDRSALKILLQQDQFIQCIIPRGGEQLIRFTVENSRIPVIKHYMGVCSVFVDATADPEMAESIVLNAKCQRPSVCNAAENLLVHRACPELLTRLARALVAQEIELRVDADCKQVLDAAHIPAIAASEADWGTEYNDAIISIRIVDDLADAIAFINQYGSGHSDAIVSSNKANAEIFMRAVDSSTVYHNASTRFTDGFEFGLGAEIGISTDRLHARGPMGLNELCTYKYVIYGQGEIR